MIKNKIITGHVISLEDGDRRRQALRRSYQIGINACIFDALLPGQIADFDSIYKKSSISFLKRYGRAQTFGELACLISHKRLYEKLLRSEGEYFLILEDDFIPQDSIIALKDLYQSASNYKLDVLILGYSKSTLQVERRVSQANPFVRKINIGTGRIQIGVRAIETTCGALSYIVSRKFINLALSNKDNGIVADDWAYYLKMNLNIFHAVSPIFREDYTVLPSALEFDRSNNSKKNYSIKIPLVGYIWRITLGKYRIIRYWFLYVLNTIIYKK